jgi:hypothetical protein
LSHRHRPPAPTFSAPALAASLSSYLFLRL